MHTQVVEFNSKQYFVGQGTIPNGAIDIDELTGSEQVELYNLVTSSLGGRRVNKFSDKKAARRRITDALIKFDSLDELPSIEAEKAKPAPKAKKAKPAPVDKVRPSTTIGGTRGMRFVFPFHGHDNLRKIKSEDSLRGRVAAAMRKGVTFEGVVAIVHQFDQDRGSTPGHQERRAYEVIRLLHYYVGYGVRQDERGRVFIHTDE